MNQITSEPSIWACLEVLFKNRLTQIEFIHFGEKGKTRQQNQNKVQTEIYPEKIADFFEATNYP